MWLQTKVPAVLDTAAGSPALRISATQALIGRVAKWAAGPSFTTGLSIGCLPSLSRMRASWTLIATRSRQSSVRPPAWPTHSTISGFTSSIAARSTPAECA